MIRNQKGFVSVNLHKSLDGKRVINYAEWKTKEDFEAIFKNPDVTPHMQKVLELCTEKNDGRLYELVHTDRKE